MKIELRTYRLELQKMLRLSLPIIIAQVGSVLMSITDNMMVGDLGAAPLAAAGIANPIFFLIASIGIGVFAAIAPLVAKARGQGKEHKCGLFLYAGMKLSFSLGLVLMVVLFIISAYFEVLRQSPEVEILAKSYLKVIATSIVPMMFFFSVKHFSDGLGVTRPAMVITLIGLVVNVFLNWILIYGHWGFSPMGLYGSGLATLVARVVMACLMIVYVLEAKFFQAFLPNILENHPTETYTKAILKLGLPSGLQYFFELGAFSGAAVVVGWLGVKELAAHNVIFSIATFTYMIAAGISFAGAISVGNAVGLNSRQQVLRAGTISLALVVLLMSFSSITLLIFGKQVISLYNNESEILNIAVPLLFIFVFYQLADGVQAVSIGILRGVSDVNIPTIITIIAYWVVGLPMSYVLSDLLQWGVQGAWIGLSLGLLVSAVLLTLRFYVLAGRKQLTLI